MSTFVVIAICALGIVLSGKSVLVLGRRAPWTSAGWLLTILYFVALIVRLRLRYHAGERAEYLTLAALIVAFVVAGFRDEPQAEPWWWPTHYGSTRRAKRTRTG